MRINITPEEFARIVMIYLLDKVNNPDEIYPEGEDFDKIVEDLQKVKSSLTRFYLDADIDSKIYYKRLRGLMKKDNTTERFTIQVQRKEQTNESENINNAQQDNEINKYQIKDIVKRVIKTIRKRRFYKARFLSDEELDAIIEKIINKGE